MFCSRLVVPLAGFLLTGAFPTLAQLPPTQLDRIEQKLDLILHRLDQLQAGQATEPKPAPSSTRAASAGPSSVNSTANAAPETMAGGAVAIVHPAPGTPAAAHEIPPNSVGGFVYAGGAIQLADLAERGVRYTGLAGVEWQGWLRAKETGRYQLELDGSTISQRTYNTSTCVFAGWLEDHVIGVQDTTPSSNIARPAPFSLILGADLQPGLYKLRLWATCTPTVPNLHVSVALLEKAPSDLNLRPVTGADLVHKQR